MNKEFTAIIKQAGEWWVGWIEEIPGVNCQEKTRQKLIETLKETLRGGRVYLDSLKQSISGKLSVHAATCI